ncbi:MAG: hypothetical protein AAB708_00175 [Patescibacteria group bacterium]
MIKEVISVIFLSSLTTESYTMPNPTKHLNDLGLWPKSELPTQDVRKVLIHLTQPGNPRLYVESVGKWSFRSSLSNSEHTPGWPTMIGSQDVIRRGLVELDPELIGSTLRTIRAYRISDKGREALAQMEAYEVLAKLINKEVPKILERQRRIFGAKPPA